MWDNPCAWSQFLSKKVHFMVVVALEHACVEFLAHVFPHIGCDLFHAGLEWSMLSGWLSHFKLGVHGYWRNVVLLA